MVTVLITLYNSEKYIWKALDSIYEQTYDSWKILLVDDASTDNSVKLIQPYLKDSRIKLVRHSYNQGQSKSLNTGLANIDTPYFIQLDADDWFYPNTLEVLMEESSNHPKDVALFSGNINIVTEDETGKISPLIIKKGAAYTDKYQFLLANSSAWPRCYRTSILKKIGGWPIGDPYEGRYVEDIRILLRLIENYRFHWVDKELLYHRRHHTNMTNSNIKETAATFRWIIKNTLKRWGDKYKPNFRYHEDGNISLAGLTLKAERLPLRKPLGVGQEPKVSKKGFNT